LAEAESAQSPAMERQRDENGVSIECWSDEMLATFESAWLEVVEEQSQDEFFKKVWDDYQSFHESYALWEKHAFLPRK